MIALQRIKRPDSVSPSAHLINEDLLSQAVDMPSAEYSGGEREFFRINTEVALHCWPLGAGSPSGKAVRSRVNLSGGGMCLPISRPMQVGERVWLEMILPDAQSSLVTCIGRVVRLLKDESGCPLAACEFLNLTTKDQDRIIAFCLAEQRKLLRQKVRVANATYC